MLYTNENKLELLIAIGKKTMTMKTCYYLLSWPAQLVNGCHYSFGEVQRTIDLFVERHQHKSKCL